MTSVLERSSETRTTAQPSSAPSALRGVGITYPAYAARRTRRALATAWATAGIAVLAVVGTGIMFIQAQQVMEQNVTAAHRDLVAAKSAAASREATLNTRINHLAAALHPPAELSPTRDRTSFGDGLYTVGLEVAPGAYATTSATASCYWEVDSSPQRSNMLHNGFGSRGLITIHLTRGQELQTQACGEWTLQK